MFADLNAWMWPLDIVCFLESLMGMCTTISCSAKMAGKVDSFENEKRFNFWTNRDITIECSDSAPYWQKL